MFTFFQVKHTTDGDEIGQPLSYEKTDEYLLQFHTQMKNAINNAKVLGMSIRVLDEQLNQVFPDWQSTPYQWVREIEPEPEPEPEPEEPEGE